ncbi:NUDIX domain-containing protein [Gracilibacillus sp. S3-1-1]|uniref:NUDIX domain-containing protein n=1 Tax=Gracilibacillus pellucidus TaxID=3095368 RepID=A0ACC6M858_9BACI|nr:NUDIX domain-containing protein [Gracilibacillus sp. S3-1-1]MDX8047149.1 NUDIX domain-containing protein [Gracilibacillus sp. S3-1-1]
MNKAYGYVTRWRHGKRQVLVFRHSIPAAGIQIPKGTVKEGETPLQAVVREMKEETGLEAFKVVRFLTEDDWNADDGAVHHRFFYEMEVAVTPDEWDFRPVGGGEEEGLTFHYFWINSIDEVELARGHADYLHCLDFEGK